MLRALSDAVTYDQSEKSTKIYLTYFPWRSEINFALSYSEIPFVNNKYISKKANTAKILSEKFSYVINL